MSGNDFEELVKIALKHGMSHAAAVSWATKVQQDDQKIMDEAIKDIPQQFGRYVPLRNFLHELEGRLLREDSDR